MFANNESRNISLQKCIPLCFDTWVECDNGSFICFWSVQLDKNDGKAVISRGKFEEFWAKKIGSRNWRPKVIITQLVGNLLFASRNQSVPKLKRPTFDPKMFLLFFLDLKIGFSWMTSTEMRVYCFWWVWLLNLWCNRQLLKIVPMLSNL